jgi:hypothetical protein
MDVIRISMWSGPRNISTAMMRSWGNRADTFVVDEPFYAYYLKATRKKHPGFADVIAAGETDWRKIVARLTGPIPRDRRIFFQKQMTHHLLTNSFPPVVDAKDVLQNPKRILRLLCDAIDVEFDPAMVSWRPGLRDTDGVWAKYWYGEVERSTSFKPYQRKDGVLPDRLREIYEQCSECYQRLYQYRLH